MPSATSTAMSMAAGATATHATSVLWATDAEVAQAVATWLRPGYLLVLFLFGWALDVHVFNSQKIDYATVLDLNQNELREPRHWICVAVALACFLSASHAVILRRGTNPDVLWAPAVVYVWMLVALFAPLPRPLERRLGAWRRPLRSTLWCCIWPDWKRETSFREVIVADGLTSLAKSFFDLGLSTCVAFRSSGSPLTLAFSSFTAAFDPRAPSTDILVPGSLAESGSHAEHPAAAAGAPGVKTLQLTLQECTRSPIPYFLWTVPSIIRARQCIVSAKFASNGQARNQHYANLAKYISALPAVLLVFCIAHAGPASWPFGADDFEVMWLLASLFNAVFSVMWDLVFDWGLLQPKACVSKITANTGLRPVLLLRPVIPVYHCVIALNLLGRTLWSLRWSQQCTALGAFVCSTVQQSSEVLRRCMWNVLRVEWQVIKCELHSNRSTAPVPV